MRLGPELLGKEVEVVKDFPIYEQNEIAFVWKRGTSCVITDVYVWQDCPDKVGIARNGHKEVINAIEFDEYFYLVKKEIEKPTFKPTTFEEGLKANPRLFQCLGAFACDMQNRLDVKAEEKGGWSNWRKNCTQEYLYRKANEHFNEINRPGRLYSEVIKECADTANYLMMIADNIRTKE